MSQAVATRRVEGIEVPTPGTWHLDPAHTSITAVARHLMIAKVRGSFTRFSGAIHIDEEPEASWVEIEIDASSIDTREPKRDEHLRSSDFLDVERYPTLQYRSTRLARKGKDRFALEGELTIREVTQPVTLDVTYLGAQTDPWGGSRIAFTAAAEIDREAFGMTWNQALETGGVLVGKTLKIELEVEASLQA